MDELEIEHQGRSYRGFGHLDVSVERHQRQTGTNMDGSLYSIIKPVAPFIRGSVIFESPVTLRELMNVTNATARHKSPNGRRTVFEHAAMISVDAGTQPNEYEIDLSGSPCQASK